MEDAGAGATTAAGRDDDGTDRAGAVEMVGEDGERLPGPATTWLPSRENVTGRAVAEGELVPT